MLGMVKGSSYVPAGLRALDRSLRECLRSSRTLLCSSLSPRTTSTRRLGSCPAPATPVRDERVDFVCFRISWDRLPPLRIHYPAGVRPPILLCHLRLASAALSPRPPILPYRQPFHSPPASLPLLPLSTTTTRPSNRFSTALEQFPPQPTIYAGSSTRSSLRRGEFQFCRKKKSKQFWKKPSPAFRMNPSASNSVPRCYTSRAP